MTALIQPPMIIEEEQRVILYGIDWPQYESLLATLGDYPGLKLTYLEGALEIFTPSAQHETLKKVIARLLERYAEEMDIPLHGYGSTTFREQTKARGLEPDECYCIGQSQEIPDLAIEVNLTSGGLDKLSVYQGLGVSEVLIWQAEQLRLYDLRGEQIRIVESSQFLPELDLSLLAESIDPQNQPQAIKIFLQRLRAKP